MIAQLRATLDDLMRIKGRAELIDGKIVVYQPFGHRPGRLKGYIMASLDDYARRTGRGEAFGTLLAYAVTKLASGRESFSPATSYYDGPFPANPMSYVDGPPTFAVEVRSESDYGPAADREYVDKRADYFEAGTRVVWDVDPGNKTVACYRADVPDQPTTFYPGDQADAEPAVPGWRLDVAALFA